MIRKAVFSIVILLHVGCSSAADTSDKDKAFADLLPHIQSRIKANELFVQMDVMGHNQRVQVTGADDKSLTVKADGTESPIPWRLVTPETVAALGKIVAQDDLEGALAAVDYCIASAQKETAGNLLDTAFKLDKDKKFEKELLARQERLAKGAAPASGAGGDKKPATPQPAPAFTAQETGEWPQLGYDGGNRFATPGSIKFPIGEKWRYIKASPVRHVASTVTAKNKVILSCTGEHNGDAKQGDPSDNPYLLALDLATGTKAWSYSPKNDWAIGDSLAYADGSVIFNDDGFGGVNVDTGAKTWGGGADSWGVINVDTPAGLIVNTCTMKVDNAGTGVSAFSLQGAHKWTALKEDGAKLQVGMPFCSVCQGGGNVYASAHFAGGPITHAKGLYAFKQTDGTDVWKLEGEWGGVSFDGHFVYSVKKDDGKLYCLKPADGATLWSVPVGGPAQHPPGHGRGLCIVITDAGAIAAFPTECAGAGKSVAWQGATAKPFPPQALALAGLRMGNAEVTDDTKHTYRRAVLAIAEGAGTNGVVVIANGAAIQVFDLKTGGGVWSSPWDEKTFGPAGNPNIAGGCLIVSGKSGVVCFGPPK